MNISGEMKSKLNKYAELVHQTNQEFNLTGAKSVDEIYNMHIEESLLVAKYLPAEFKSLIDIGSGAGFPAIPLAVLYPHSRITMIESIGKKASFLEKAVLSLNLSNARIIEGRAEAIAQDKIYREKFDVVTARFVAHLNVLLEYTLPFLTLNGTAIFPKPPFDGELKEATNALSVLGGEIISVNHESVSESPRDIIVIKKTKNTPKEYPREIGLPSKKPL